MGSLPRTCPECRARLDWASAPRDGQFRCPECRAPISRSSEGAGARWGPGGGYDAENEAPVRKKGNSYLPVLIVLGGALGLFALLTLGGGAAALLYYFTREPAASVASAAPEAPAELARDAGPAAVVPPQPPPKAPIEPVRAGVALPLKELKAASVFVKASTATMAATGSGFVVRAEGETAYVVTNHHVVTPPKENASNPPPMWRIPRPPFGPRGPLGPRMPFGPRLPRRGIAFDLPRGPPAELTAVFNSGSQHEQSLRAVLVADDPDADLAVLKVTGLKDAPRPIACDRAPELEETMPVVAFGFPFGAKLDQAGNNPAVTVTKGAVSALRLGKGGELAEVQLDLDLNPGNSGGPVVDEKGALVGVAFAKVTNSRIGFAVPVHKLNQMLQGHIDPPHTIQGLTIQGRTQVRVLARVADPFGRLRSPALLYGPANEVGMPRRGRDGWEKLNGAKSSALTVQGTEAAATLDLTPPANGELKVIAQVSYRTGPGQTVYGEPRTLTLSKGAPPFVPPLVPGPAASPTDFPPADAAARQDERLSNGDFTQGLKGFRTAYRHSPGNVRDALTFCVARSPREAHGDAAAFGDHTSGDGLMMVVNGGDAVDRLLWGQTVPVRAGAEYTFSLWLASWYATAPAELEVRVNGKSLGKVVAPARCGEWKQFSAAWRSGLDRQASVEIFDLNRAVSGNDFAIDDISLRGPPPGPADPPRAAAAKTGDPEMDRLLSDLEAVDGAIRKAAADRLTGMKPNRHRAAVARKLAEQLPLVEPFDREPLIRALGVWATAAEVPTLIQLLDSPEIHIRNVTLDALGKLRDERAVKPVVRCFKELNTRWHSEQALKALGPMAEKEVLALLGQPERDLWVPAIYVLAEIGTEQSLPTLREASKQFEMKGVAEGAMIAIQKRMRK